MVAQALACVPVTARRFRSALSMAGTIIPYLYSLHPNPLTLHFFRRTRSGEKIVRLSRVSPDTPPELYSSHHP